MARTLPPPPGFSRADLHVHTTFSDGAATPEDVLNYYALHSSCTVFAITDHDTLDGALCAQRHRSEHLDLYGHIELITGEEISSRDGHIIGLFLEEWIPPGMDAASTIDAIHGQGGIAVAVHPYTSWMRWAGLVGVGDLIHTLPFDAVETRNSNFTEVFANRKAELNAGGKARVGNSDGHFLDAIGRCYTEFPGTSAAELRRALLERKTVPGGKCYGLPTLCKYVLGRLRTGGSIFPRRRDFKRQAAEGGLVIKVHRDEGTNAAILSLQGKLDALSMPELKEMLTALGRSRMGMVLDLSGVERLEPAGVTALVAGMKSARVNGAGFCLAALSPACARALEVGGLLKVFPRAGNIREAKRRVGPAPCPLPQAEKECVLP